MDNRIDEITQKIYNEGVIKAKEDAEQILSEARLKADSIVKDAKKKQEELIIETQKKADEIKGKSETELKLAGNQFISNLKQLITDLITTKQPATTIHKAFDDVDFVQNIILHIINKWDIEKENELMVLLPEAKRKELTDFFELKAVETLNKGVVIDFDKRIGSGFRIGPKDGGYLISFTEQDFMNYFKEYLKDHTRKLLFD